MVNAERWQQVEQIYHAALERGAEERASFLAEACSGDDSLRREVESLLAYEDEAQNFIESPALEVAAKSLGEQRETGAVTGQTINQYKITTAIGVGGMGEVYLAEDTRLKRRVALKFLPAHFLEDKRYLNRFEREAHAVAALSHPNVCMIHEVVQTAEGRHCIVMEYVEGETLRQRMKDHPFTVSEALDVTIQIASALSAAHAAGIVHRDIKLENIMLRSDGYVKILDFGLAKLTDGQNPVADMDAATMLLNTTPGIVMGTVSYMSPEQARGLPVDARTDIWSLGVVLYELVSGQQPFKGETPTDVIIAIAEREPAPLSMHAPGVPDQLERIVKKALAKNRGERYQTAQDLLIDVKNLKRELEIETEVGRFKEGKQSGAPLLAPGSSEVATSGSRFVGIGRARAAIVIAVIGATIVAALIYASYFRRTTKPTAQNAIRSLAVLPIANLSGDPSQDYFADGLTDTLIAGLDNVAALRVISRSSVAQYKGVQKPLRDIAHELNVDAILEGSVKRTGDRVLLSVRLVHSPDEQEVWSATYDREVRDIPTLQNEVARAVTEAIQIKVTPREQVRLTQKRSIDPIAYDYFLRGRFYLNRQTKADNQTAIELFERAVATDPNFAAGFAELAQACVWRLFLFTPKEKQWEVKAFVAIEKALDLDPDLAEAHLARGRLLWTPANHFPHDKAIQEYQLALDLNPNLDEARNQLALVYGHIGLLEEALRELERALAINPSNTLARFRTGETVMFQGKYDEALAALRSVPPEGNPTLVGHEIAWSLFNLGRKDEASSVIQQFLKDHPEDNGGLFTGLQAVLAASAGQERQAEEKVQSAIEKGRGFGHFHHTDYYIACAYALMNKPDEAIKWLQSAADDGFPCYPLFEHDANLNNLRSDARFLSFLERQKQQWESFKQLDTAR